VLGSVQYDPWGVPTVGTPQPFGFTGELHSAGQVYLRARWYAPGQGTFTSRDPFAGFPEMPYSLHAYQYAYSNPVRWTDPSGENPAACALTGPGTGICLGVYVFVGLVLVVTGTPVLVIAVSRGPGDTTAFRYVDPDTIPTPAPTPDPFPPDAQPRVLPDGPQLSPTWIPPEPAPGPTPQPERPPSGGGRPAPVPFPFDVCNEPRPSPAPAPSPASTPAPSPMPSPSPTPTPRRMSVFQPGGDTPQTTQHIIDAIAAGKPTIVTYRGPGNGYKRGWLRAAPACRGSSTALWCDEYPFNTVDEGGQANNPSLRLVPSSEQRTQAGKWTSFLRSCAVGAGEKVKIEPNLALQETTWTCK